MDIISMLLGLLLNNVFLQLNLTAKIRVMVDTEPQEHQECQVDSFLNSTSQNTLQQTNLSDMDYNPQHNTQHARSSLSFNHTHLYPITLFKQTLGIQSVQSNAQRAQPDLPSIFVINCYPGFCVLFFLLHCTVCQSPEPLPVFVFFFLTLNLSHVLDLSMLNCLYCIRGDSVGQEAGMHPYWDARQ